MLARVARDYRETQRLITASRRQRVECPDLESRLKALGEELDKQIQNAFTATTTDLFDGVKGLPD
jgi:hypothetical protein